MSTDHRHLERGQGDPVVLIHGLFGDPSNWGRVMDTLADRFWLHAPQLPIDYRPGRHVGDFDAFQALADSIVDYLDARGIERASVGGNSLGGQVAVDLGLRYPDRVERLVLTGSAGLFERDLWGSGMPRVDRAWIHRQATEVFYDARHVTEDLLDQVEAMLADRAYRRFILRVARATRAYDVRAELGRLAQPTLLVWGREDRITPPTVAERFADELPDARLRFLPQCGHVPPLERPEAFGQTLAAFLGDPVVRGSLPAAD
ncbi:MAG: alpha/beta fold hydrolase [Candidatus Bipolaricaulia bacterium]